MSSELKESYKPTHQHAEDYAVSTNSEQPFYETLKKFIHEELRTFLQGTADDSGRFQFSGFYGIYRVALQGNAISKEAEFRLVNGMQNEFTYKLEHVRIYPEKEFRTIH